MPPPSDRPYEIVFLGRQGALLRAYAERAAGRGLLKAYVSAIKSIQHRLATAPLEWGDPQNKLHELRLLLFHGMQSPLHVLYAVDKRRRIVYVQKIMPIPNRGLD
jgi:hypothetical protein